MVSPIVRGSAPKRLRHKVSLITATCPWLCLPSSGKNTRPAIGRTPSIEKKPRSEEHTSELQSRLHLVCRLLLEKKNADRHSPPARYYLSSLLLPRLGNRDCPVLSVPVVRSLSPSTARRAFGTRSLPLLTPHSHH